MPHNKGFEQLISKALQLMSEARYLDAAVWFGKALSNKEDMSIRNNLALCFYLAGCYEQAMEAIEINLNTGIDNFRNPYSYSLASLVQTGLGQISKAQGYLDCALEGYEEGARIMGEAGLPFDNTGAYLSVLMEAAGGLGDHHRVLALFKIWNQDYIPWECLHHAAVAAFNLKDYSQAAIYWGEAAKEAPACRVMHGMAVIIEAGAIPGFALEYRFRDKADLYRQLREAFGDQSEQESFMAQGQARMALLGYLLDSDESVNEESACAVVSALVGWSGEWGLQLGKSLIGMEGLNPAIKVAVAQCLLDLGAIGPGEELLSDKGWQENTINHEILRVSYSGDLETLYEQSWMMMEKGQAEEVLEIWEGKYDNEGILYPPALLLVIEIYISMQRYDDAVYLLDLMEKISYAEQGAYHNEIMFSRALLAFSQRQFSAASRYLQGMHIESLNEEEHYRLMVFQEELGDLVDEQEEVHFASTLQPYQDRLGEQARLEIEAKHLPADARLKQGLANMPASWIDAVCLNLGILTGKGRKTREEQICQRLQEPGLIDRLLHSLDDEQRSLIEYLLQNQGWRSLNALRSRYGGLDGEGFDWLEDGTSTALGTLWSLALVMVGQSHIDGKDVKIAVIPMEIRELLDEALNNCSVAGKGRK